MCSTSRFFLLLIISCAINLQVSSGQNVSAVFKGDHCVYHNSDGTLAFNREFDDCGAFYYGTASVKKGDNFYIINEQGETLYDSGTNNIWRSEHYYIFQKDSLFGIKDLDFNTLEEPLFLEVRDFFKGILPVKSPDGWKGWTPAGMVSRDRVIFQQPDEIALVDKKCLDADDKVDCNRKQMLYDIYTKLKFPVKARKKKLSGTVVVRFIISENGDIENATILKDIGSDCGKAAIKAIKKLHYDIPAKMDGLPCKSVITVPVRFKSL